MDFKITEDDTGFKFIEGTESPPMKPDIAAKTAERYAPVNPLGLEESTQYLIAGSEKSMRRNALAMERLKNQEETQSNITGFVEQKQRVGSPMTLMDFAQIQEMGTALPYTLQAGTEDTFFERKIADVATKEISKGMIPVEPIDEELDDEDQQARAQRDAFSKSPEVLNFIAKQQVAQTLMQDVEARYQETSWASFGVDLGMSMVPFVGSALIMNETEGAPSDSWLPGTNLRQQYEYIWNADTPEEMQARAKQAYEGINAINPLIARQFARGLVEYSDGEELLNNLVGVLDVAGVSSSFIKGGITAATMKTIFKQGTGKAFSIPGILDGSGQTLDAAFANVKMGFDNAFQKSGLDQSTLGPLRNTVPSILDVDKWMGPAGTTPFSAANSARIADVVKAQAGGLVNMNLLNPLNIVRIERGTAEHAAALVEAEKILTTLYPGVNNKVLSVEVVNAADNALTNVDVVKFQIGKANGQLFNSIPEVTQFARFMGMKDAKYKIGTRGGKYFLEFTNTVPETAESVRAALKSTVTNTDPTPTGWYKNWWSTADELVPSSIAKAMKVATYGGQQLSQFSGAVLQNALEQLPRGTLLKGNSSRVDFNSFVEHQRSFFDATTGQTGKWSQDLPTFTADWAAFHGRIPTVEEATAYATYRQVNDIEYVQRVMNINTGKQRKGVLMHRIPIGNKILTNAFEGAVLPKVPWDVEGNFGLLVVDPTNKRHVYMLHNMSSAKSNPVTGAIGRNDVDDLVLRKGYKVIQLSKFSEDALRATQGISKLPDGPIDYVVVKASKTAPLPAMPIEYKGSGHMAYSHTHMISQPIVKNYSQGGAQINRYTGDNTLFMQPTAESARRVAADVEKARVLYLNGDKKGLKNFLPNSAIPMSYGDFVRLFKGKDAPFDLNLPFLTRERGRTTYDIHANDLATKYGIQNLEDYKTSKHNLYHDDLNLQYALERDAPARTSINIGTPNNPQYSIQPAPLVEANTTLMQTAANMARTKYLDNVKIKAAERFVQEFGDLIDPKVLSPSDMKNYPMRALDPSTPLLNNSGDAAKYKAAREYRRTIHEFLKTFSDDDLRVQAAVNSITEKALSLFGEVRGMKVMDDYSPYLLPFVKDPASFLRRAVFHTKMGFWNIKQYPMQAQGVLTTAAIAGPKNAYDGFALGRMMYPLHLSGTNAIIEEAAKRATAFGIKAEQFKEMYKALQDSGFQHVGKEFGTYDDVLNPRVVQTKKAKVLENGLYFFREGEKINRHTAYAAAYLEWRRKNPLLPFSKPVQDEILNRADTFSVNMSRASNAAWNKGWTSIPTQFWSYNARLMDLMLGKRLTGAEKGRLTAMYSVLYGLPAGTIGARLGAFLPSTELVRDALQMAGIDYQESVLTDMMVNGVPQALAGLVLGEDAPDLSSTFGVNGNTFFYDLLGGGSSATDTIGSFGGAGGRLASHAAVYTYEAFANLLVNGFGGVDDPVMASILKANSDKMTTPWAAAQPLIQEISSLSNAQKSYYATVLGNWYMKNDPERILYSGLDPETGQMRSSAWMAGIAQFLGVQPIAIDKAYGNSDYIKMVKDIKISERRKALKYYRMMTEAGSPEDREKYTQQLNLSLAHFDQRERLTILRDFIAGRKSFADEMKERSTETREELDLTEQEIGRQ